MEYVHTAVGAVFENDTCTFTVWAPQRKSVQLVLQDRTHQMTGDGWGYWTIAVKEAKPGDQYKFTLDNDQVLPDPASRCQPDVHGHSVVTDRGFAWTDNSWKGIPLGDMIMYELHVGTFTNEGTFEGVIKKLPYLKSLGVNAIELMPVGQFPGSRNWGYDGVYPFATQFSYGGIPGLKKLVDEAHREGIAVVLDVVYNHLGPEGNYLAEFGHYFTDRYKTGWGKAINFDDRWSDGVRNYFWQNALMWLDEFHIDGLRLDAVHAIWDSGSKHFISELASKVREFEKKSGKKKVLIAEFDLNNPRYISSPEAGGYGLDGQWIDEFHHALHTLVTGEVDGYYEDFGNLSHMARALRDSYVYTGQYSTHRKKNFGSYPHQNPYNQFVVFAQNHDQVGNRMLGDRLGQAVSLEGLKLTAAAYLLSPCVPMIFMGEEYGEKNPFQYFISHSDKELIQLIRKGRKDEFSYFKWEGELPDPQSEKTFNQCKLSWDFNEDKKKAALLDFYKHLISFRKTRRAMQGIERNTLSVLPGMKEEVIAFERTFEGDTILVVLNFKKGKSTFDFDRPLLKILDSSSIAWAGPGELTNVAQSGKAFDLNPQSVLIFELMK
jgi:maltooligosyltrehalose trehalohydrolase